MTTAMIDNVDIGIMDITNIMCLAYCLLAGPHCILTIGCPPFRTILIDSGDSKWSPSTGLATTGMACSGSYCESAQLVLLGVTVEQVLK